jgi:hypothetical protein
LALAGLGAGLAADLAAGLEATLVTALGAFGFEVLVCFLAILS